MIVIYLSKRHNTHIPYIIRLNVIKSARDFLELPCVQKNIEEEGRRLRALGYEVYGPDACSRTRPDGTVVEWKLLHFGKPDLPIDFPF